MQGLRRLALAALGVVAAVAAVPLLVWTRWRGRVEPLYAAARRLLAAGFRLAGIALDVAGAERVPAGPVVLMANHTSAADPVALLLASPRRLVFLAKRELFAVPLLGAAMRAGGFVPVERGRREQAAQALEQASRRLAEGLAVAIYPEGTRSADGRLLPFRRGGFRLAVAARVPIVPVSIVGAHRVLPRGRWWPRPGRIRVEFHAPVPATEPLEELVARVRAAIAGGLRES